MDFEYLDMFEAIPITNNEHFDESNSYSFEYKVLISPPISISDNSLKKNDECINCELSFNKNESDVRESNFLKRMKNNSIGSDKVDATSSNIDNDIKKNDFLIEYKSVSKNSDSLSCAKSSLKTKFASLSAIDRSILKRSANRKASRNRVPSYFNFTFGNNIKNENVLENNDFIVKDIW